MGGAIAVYVSKFSAAEEGGGPEAVGVFGVAACLCGVWPCGRCLCGGGSLPLSRLVAVDVAVEGLD